MPYVGITLESPSRQVFDSGVDELGRRVIQTATITALGILDDGTTYRLAEVLSESGSDPAEGTFTISALAVPQFVGEAAANEGTFTIPAQAVSDFIGAAPVTSAVFAAENPKRILLRVVEARIGANDIIELDLVREDLAAYDLDSSSPVLGSATHAGAPSPPPPEQDDSDQSKPGATRCILMDIPQLQFEDDGPGFYAAASGKSDGWGGALLFEKQGGEFVEIAELSQRAVIGTAQTRLDPGPVTTFDEDGRTYVFDDVNTVDVSLIDDVSSLTSVTDEQLLGGANGAALGSHGKWEVIGFGTATQLGARKWRLSHLLRGMKGSEWAIAKHSQSDQFVLLDPAIRRIKDTYSELDTTRSFKAVSIGNDIDAASAISFKNTGVSLKPLSPVFLRGEEDEVGNRTIRWYRRSRLNGFAGRDTYDPPPALGESIERYEVDIYNAANTVVVRTITTAIEAASYTAAQQTADHGSVPSSLNVCIYQLSETRGRGYSGCTNIALFDSIPAVLPTLFPYIVALSVPGIPSASKKYIIHPPPLVMFLPASFAGSRATLDTAATGSTVFSIRKNGTEIGTITFSAGGTVGVFAQVGSGDISFATSDKLTLISPASADPTAADLGLALLGYRAAD